MSLPTNSSSVHNPGMMYWIAIGSVFRTSSSIPVIYWSTSSRNGGWCCFPRGSHAEALIIQSPWTCKSSWCRARPMQTWYDKLPQKSIEAPKTIIMLSITAFCQDIFDMVFGNKEKHFVHSNCVLYSEFKQEIIGTTPDLRPSESLTEARCLVTKSRTEPRSLQDVRQVTKRWGLFLSGDLSNRL